MWYPPEHYGASTAAWMQVIKTQLEATGEMQVTLNSQEWSTYVPALTGGKSYGAGVLGWFFDYPDPSNYLDPFVFNRGEGTNVTLPATGSLTGTPINDKAKQLVALLNQADIETDMTKRADLIHTGAGSVCRSGCHGTLVLQCRACGIPEQHQGRCQQRPSRKPEYRSGHPVLLLRDEQEPVSLSYDIGAGAIPPQSYNTTNSKFNVSPIAIIALIIGVPSLLLLAYVFARGSTGLRRYILTRIALTLPMIFILATMVFFILRILPGDPVTSALGPKGTPEMIQHIRATLGLNDPLIVQYGRFLWNMVTLRFGNSLVGGHRPIIDEMSERFPATLELIIPASILALLIGYTGGPWPLPNARKHSTTPCGFIRWLFIPCRYSGLGYSCSSFSESVLDGCRSRAA